MMFSQQAAAAAGWLVSLNRLGYFLAVWCLRVSCVVARSVIISSGRERESQRETAKRMKYLYY